MIDLLFYVCLGTLIIVAGIAAWIIWKRRDTKEILDAIEGGRQQMDTHQQVVESELKASRGLIRKIWGRLFHDR